MVRLMRFLLPLVLAGLVSCGPGKTVPEPVPALPVRQVERLFPVPFFPTRETQIEGRPVADLAPGWTAASLYGEDHLSPDQKAWVATLEPAGGEGLVSPGFTKDFDHDGKKETVSFGAWARGRDEGNFVLVTREGSTPPEVLLLKELPGPPRFTVFTLKTDGSLWFGGGVDAGEVTMKLSWDTGHPVFNLLTQD